MVQIFMPNAEGPHDVVTVEHDPCAQFSRLVTESRVSDDGETLHVRATVTLRPAPPNIVITVKP